MARPDPNLVARAQAGDRDAFSELVMPHRPAVIATMERRLAQGLKARLDADDLVQETLLRAMLAIGNCQFRDEGALRGWLLAIADNVARETHRRHVGARSRDIRRETEAVEEHDRPAGQPDAIRLLRREERYERLSRALRQLSPEHRRVIALARLEGQSLAEVGAQLGRSAEATSALLLRALRQLRQGFDPTDSMGLPDRPLDIESAQDEL